MAVCKAISQGFKKKYFTEKTVENIFGLSFFLFSTFLRLSNIVALHKVDSGIQLLGIV